MTDLKHKHWAIVAIAVLVLIFIGLTAWYFFSARTAEAPTSPTATSTTPVAEAEPIHITESGKYYDIDSAYPSSTPLPGEANTAAISLMKSFLLKEQARFKDGQNFDGLTQQDIDMMRLDERKMAHTVTYKTYMSPRTISYVYTIYEDTLGAHPNAYFRTFTFDTKTGEALALSDLFAPGTSYLNTLSTRTRADLPRIINTIAGNPGVPEEIESGTQPYEDSFQSFYLDGTNLVIIFPPYQVGPYALGLVLDPIPLSQLSGIRSEYLP